MLANKLVNLKIYMITKEITTKTQGFVGMSIQSVRTTMTICEEATEENCEIPEPNRFNVKC